MAGSALLVSASGLGSALMMLGRMTAHPQQRFGSGTAVRLQLMQACALIKLLATLVIPFVANTPWLAAPLALLWGGAERASTPWT